MASAYPTSVDNETPLVDGTDYVEANNVNKTYLDITAVETFVGASGATQAKNTDVLTFLQGLNPMITLTYVDADTIQASAGVVICANAGGSIKVLRKNTSTTNITFSDIDAGARATSTQYYIYANGDASATTVTFKISASATTPTGITNYRRIGSFKTNATGSGEVMEGSIYNDAHYGYNFGRQLVKAWLNMVGTGTISINDSFNVSSLTDNGTGDYTITLITAMSNANYSAVALAKQTASGVATTAHIDDATSFSTTALRIVTQDGGSAADAPILCVTVIGD